MRRLKWVLNLAKFSAAARTGVARPANECKRGKVGRAVLCTPLLPRSPRNLFAIAQEPAGDILARFAGEPHNRVGAFLH